MSRALESLLVKAGISKWNCATWFAKCDYDGQNLLCSDRDDLGSIERMFLSRLQEANPKIRLVFSAAIDAPPRPASAFKKAYTGRSENTGKQGDFFG